MKENRTLKLPIIGRVQHGEQVMGNNGKTRVKEYGYFIAKIQDENMQPYLDKFNNLIKGKKSIDIQLLEKDTFTKKRVRYNQGGTACYCMDNEDIGKQKEKKLWKPIECNSNCIYLKKDENGKSPCNRVGWLKFFIPEISTDRIWLMRITSQESIDNIDAYLQIQESQGNSIKNLFTIFLTQREQTNCFGNTFTNYVLDIILKEQFNSNNQIPQNINNQDKLSTKTDQTVNNNIDNKSNNQSSEETTSEVKAEEKVEKTSKPKKTTKSKKSEDTSKEQNDNNEQTNNNSETLEENSENYYVFESLSSETIITKDGSPKEYNVGKFYDMNDKPHNIIVKPEYKQELEKCELGTLVKLSNIQSISGKMFALNLVFIQKLEKNIAA